MCWFSAKHTTLRSVNKDWLVRNQDNEIITTLLKCVFQGQQTADVVWELDLTKELKGVAMERYMRNYKTEFFIPVALVRFLHS
jgi:hypothetical protein